MQHMVPSGFLARSASRQELGRQGERDAGEQDVVSTERIYKINPWGGGRDSEGAGRPRPPSRGASLQPGLLGMLMAPQALKPAWANWIHCPRERPGLAHRHRAARGTRLRARVFVYSLLETPRKGVGADVPRWLESAQDKPSLTRSPSWVWESAWGHSSWRTQEAPGARKGNTEETTSVPKRGCPHGLRQRDRRQVPRMSPWERKRGREPRPRQLEA